jgi:hypothetical protein
MSKKIQQYKVCQLWKMKMRTKIESAQNKQAKNSLIYLILQLAHTRQYCTMKSNSLWSSYFISFSLQIQFHVIFSRLWNVWIICCLNFALLKIERKKQACKTLFFLHISVIFQKEPTSLLICTIRSDFKGGRNVALQTQIYFSDETQKGQSVLHSQEKQIEGFTSCAF